jgi:hypothetical protein
VSDRIIAELSMVRQVYPGVDSAGDGSWLKLSAYALPPGWNRSETEIAIQVPPAYPGVPPYGIYVPAGILFNGIRPQNYTEPASNQPPFGGAWGLFSWQVVDGEWRPAAEAKDGTNLLTWIRGFAERFKEGV